jgi:glycosyltransferase involved in cell wall biosynthesis
LVDCESIHPAPEYGRDLVLSASLRYRAMVETVLGAMTTVVREARDVRLKMLVGVSSSEDVQWTEDVIRRQGLSDSVSLLGFMDEDMLAKEYSTALALLAPLEDDEQSRSRFPTKIAEYLSSGRPVVTTPVGDLPLYLVDGQDVAYATSCAPREYAAAVLKLISDNQLLHQMGSSGRQVALSQFDFRPHGPQLMAFLQGVTADFHLRRAHTRPGKRGRGEAA